MQSFELLCRIECSGEVKATCVNRELAVDPDMLFGVFVSTVGRLIGRLPLLKPSGSENPPCDAAILKMIEMMCSLLENNLSSG